MMDTSQGLPRNWAVVAASAPYVVCHNGSATFDIYKNVGTRFELIDTHTSYHDPKTDGYNSFDWSIRQGRWFLNQLIAMSQEETE